MRLPPPWPCLAVAVAALLGATSPVAAQRLDGRVLDAGSGGPVEGALVQLVAADSGVLANGVTDRRGAFRLDARGGTPVYVRVTRLGYRELRTPLAELQPGAGPLVIRLESAPVALPEVAAEATRANRYLQGVGFYERQRMGFGSFVTREMIERDYFTARTPGDILRTQRGLHVREGRDSAIVYMPRSMLRLETRGEEAGTCPARVYINGLDQGSAVPVNLRPDGIEAIEIYRGPADVPAQFGGARGACGVILIWLRTGQS